MLWFNLPGHLNRRKIHHLRKKHDNKKRRTFEPSLKLEVIRLINEQGQSVQNVSESMSIGQTAIRRWLQQYSTEQNGQPGIGKPLTAEQQRIRPTGAGLIVHSDRGSQGGFNRFSQHL